ncbi:MAG: LysE family transporter [Bacteroidota bacterium]
MNLLLIFLIIFVISALGSTPPGLINMVVLQRSIRVGKKAGIMTALGTFIPEFVYTFIAVYGYTTINSNVEIGKNIQLFGGLVLVGLAIFYFFRRPEEPNINPTSTRKDRFRSFRKGFFTASVNMLIIPFWAFLAGYLDAHGFPVVGLPECIVFALASATGALLIFLLYVRLGDIILNRLSSLVRYSNTFLALLFLSLGLYQLLRIY